MKRTLSTGSALMGCLVLATQSAFPSLARAEESQPAAQGTDYNLTPITVTANKRAERLQDVPISVASINTSMLKQSGVVSTMAIANLVPGVQMVQENAGSNNSFSIRGVTQNDYGEHEEAPVAVYMDGAYLSHSAATGALLFDTERVEVLRGPQGTLFGRNATAGAVQFISKAPTEQPDGYIQTSLGNYWANHTEAAYGQGIGGGWAFRLSVANDYMKPFMTNTLAPKGKNPGNNNSHAARFQLRYSPDSDLTATTNAHVSWQNTRSGFYKWINTAPDPDNHYLGTVVPDNVNAWAIVAAANGGTEQSCAGCNILGYKVPAGQGYYTGAANRLGFNRQSMWGITETINYRMGDNLNLTSITDYSHYRKSYFDDSDSTPDDIFNYWTHVNTGQFSQEFHIDNGNSGRFRWIAGVYYLQIDGHYVTGVGYGTAYANALGNVYDAGGPIWLSPPAGPGAEQTYAIKTRSWSEFAQFDFDILPRLTFTLGGRWSSERKRFSFDFRSLTCDLQGCPEDTSIPPFQINPAQNGDAARISKGDWSGKVALRWKLTDDIIPYISYNKGLKAGGFNAPLAQLTDENGNTVYNAYKFGEEKLYSLEIGMKNEFFDHRLRINGDVFFYNYKGYQAFNTQGAVTFITNNPAKIHGGELEIAATPIPGLNMQAGFAFLKTRIDGIALPDGTIASRQAANAPKMTFNGAANYHWALGAARAEIGTDFNYRSSQYYQLLNGPASRQPGYWLVNAHAGYTSPDKHWNAQLYVKNLFDLHYISNSVISDGQGFGQGIFGMPRTYGIQLGYSF